MKEPFVAVVVSVPEEHFSDEDDICLAAGNFVCAGLETHLTENGHSIPDWIHGGCNEDWGVYFESKLKETIYQYHICFFPGPKRHHTRSDDDPIPCATAIPDTVVSETGRAMA